MFAFIVPIQCYRYQSDLVRHSHDWTPAKIHNHAHTASKRWTLCPFLCFQECGTVPVGDPVGGVLGAHFCINHSDCCCLTARLTACNSTSASGYEVWGQRSQPESPHRLFILCTQPYIPSLPACLRGFPLAVGWQMTNSPDRQPRSSVMHAEHMK